MEEKKKRVAVYIDGSNFYFKMRSSVLNFSHLRKFDFRGLAEWLARDHTLINCRYYIGVVRVEEGNQKGQKLRKEQQKLFAHLLSPEQNLTLKKGYLMNNSGKYHEKGVDVQIAVDLLVGAYDDLYDTAIVISSDTDLIPAIKKIRYLGKEVEYIGFAHHPSIALQKCVTLSKLLIKEELEPFVIKNS